MAHHIRVPSRSESKKAAALIMLGIVAIVAVVTIIVLVVPASVPSGGLRDSNLAGEAGFLRTSALSKTVTAAASSAPYMVPVESCKDSDKENANVRGMLTLVQKHPDGSIYTSVQYDNCVDSAGSVSTAVTEGFCAPDGKSYNYKRLTCPSGWACTAGACAPGVSSTLPAAKPVATSTSAPTSSTARVAPRTPSTVTPTTNAATSDCLDGDYGVNLDVASSVQSRSKKHPTLWDRCASTGVHTALIYEAVCKGDTPTIVPKQCPTGKVCDAGKCIYSII